MSDNLIHLPGQQQKTPEEVAKQAQQNSKVVLQLLDKNRKQGIERLDKTCQELEELRARADDPEMEKRLRALETAVRSACTAIEAISGLMDVVMQDFMSLVAANDRNFEATMYQGLHLQTLLKTLVDKGVTTEQELEANWKTVLRDNGIKDPKES
jgi:membrane-associated HD superfamily phosphohydrolase